MLILFDVTLIWNVSNDPSPLMLDADLPIVQEMAYDKLNALPVGLKLLWESLEKPIVRIANQIALINDREICKVTQRERARGKYAKCLQPRWKLKNGVKYFLGFQQSAIETTMRIYGMEY